MWFGISVSDAFSLNENTYSACLGHHKIFYYLAWIIKFSYNFLDYNWTYKVDGLASAKLLRQFFMYKIKWELWGNVLYFKNLTIWK